MGVRMLSFYIGRLWERSMGRQQVASPSSKQERCVVHLRTQSQRHLWPGESLWGTGLSPEHLLWKWLQHQPDLSSSQLTSAACQNTYRGPSINGFPAIRQEHIQPNQHGCYSAITSRWYTSLLRKFTTSFVPWKEAVSMNAHLLYT